MSSRPSFRYMVNSLKIYSKNQLCEKKQKMLYNLHEKYANWDSSDRCSEFYMYSLEVLKMIKRHILNNDAFLKNDINFKMTYNDYEPDVESFLMPTEEPEMISFLSANDVKKLIQDSDNVADLLEFVLQNYPLHELTTCVDVAMDVISQNKGENLTFGTNRTVHKRNGKKIEVMPIGIKGN